MYYVYILRSSKDLKKRFREHNEGRSQFTKGHLPWELAWYCAFDKEQKAKDFELYLKSGSGKAFVYKRLVNVASSKDALTEKGAT